MSKKISGSEYPLAKIFSSDFEYTIPSYQRPYAWSFDQASELFDDLYDFYQNEPEDGYFLGSIVLIKKEENPYSEVIDGQQRLTTLTILLAVITVQLEGELRLDFIDYLREPGRASQGLKPKPRLVLRERDKTFFTNYIQDLRFKELFSLEPATLENESQKNIQSNSRLLYDRLLNKFKGDQTAICKFGAFIVQRCFLVAVSTPSQQSAFRVFSVMNSRGLDLQPTDIIKADIIGQLDSEQEREEYNERWENMEVELGRSGFNDLFSYARMIYAKEKAKKSLLEEFRSHVLGKVSSPGLLISEVLEPYADALSMVKNSNYEATSHAEEINIYLRWLNRIDNSDWIPSAILFLSRSKNNPGHTAWFFKRLERLAAFMHICALNINERIERYNQVVAELEASSSDNSPETIELDDAEKLLMKLSLGGNIYHLTPRRRNYLILRLDTFLSDGAASYDPSILTIEHVLPQTVSPDSEWAKIWSDEKERNEWVHKIANLVPLNLRRNSKAQNYDFDRKKSAYFSGKSGVSSYALTSQVLNSMEWSPAYVAQRQKELLSVLYLGWELG